MSGAVDHSLESPAPSGPDGIDTLAMPSVAESRERLLSAIDGNAGGATHPRMAWIRPRGNVGDELIWAGTRSFLSGHIHRELDIDELSFEEGDLALIGGGGAWSPAYNEFMPELLTIAEMRFSRVVVLPSTFDVSVPRVRRALERSNAVVFARERVSFEAIRDLCNAQLAHDMAFFYDLSAFGGAGEGVLNAYRSDLEAVRRRRLPEDNTDISAVCSSLDEWLATIERHAEVRTDRAHVMIAAARMGKRVRWSSNNYFKVSALAEQFEPEFDVEQLELPTDAGAPERPSDNGVFVSSGRPAERQLAHGTGLIERAQAARAIALLAEQHADGARIRSEELLEALPQLAGADGRLDAARAELLLELTNARGYEWVLMQWMNGSLAALLCAADGTTSVERDRLEWLERREAMLRGIEAGGWWRLRGRLRRLIGRDSA